MLYLKAYTCIEQHNANIIVVHETHRRINEDTQKQYWFFNIINPEVELEV